MSTSLVWFRSDLRVRDNRALHAACADPCVAVHAVFVVCPEQWLAHDWGQRRIDFTLRNVAALSSDLRELGIRLHILREATFETVPEALDRHAARLCAGSLYFNEEYEVNERARDGRVRELFERRGRRVHTFVDQTILDIGAIRTGNGSFYSVFTPFKRRWLEIVGEQGPPLELPLPCRRSPVPAADDADVPVVPEDGTPFRADLWPAGEAAARERLDEFVQERIAFYKERRDLPGVHGTSTISPYLTVGAISPRECLAAALAARHAAPPDRQEGPDTWISELIWREFYRHMLIGFPRLSMGRAFRTETEELTWSDHEERFAAWCEGSTGVPIVDAAMRQLARTGWMHNRARMIVAMYLTKDLFIDWRRGERWFMQHLVDADLANNNGGWQWSASTGADAAPYFRIFNPVSQGRKFDPDGSYVRRFVPELADVPAAHVHEPYGRAAPAFAIDYPRPIVDHAAARKFAVDAFRRLRS